MNNRTRRLAAAAVLLAVLAAVVLLLGGTISRAQGPDGTPRYLGGTGSQGGDSASLPATLPREIVSSGLVTVIIELVEPPTGLVTRPELSAAERDAAERGQLARVQAAQSGVLAALSSAGIDYRLVGRTSHAFDGLMVTVDVSQLDTILRLPGVKNAHIDRMGELLNATSVPFVQAPDVWDKGHTGAGMRIAVIDSGIDYTHPNFGSQGWPPAPGDKIVGGWDFVGDAWTSGPIGAGDSDPMDQNWHGTHVAGTAAGFGVDGGGTYTGLYDSSTPFSSMIIGPGVAPEASIYAYRVGGQNPTHGVVSEAAVIMAIEASMDPDGDGSTADHVDVINMSLGGNYGDPSLGWTVAANTAAQSGIVVVAAAGNSGDTYFVQDDPATGDWVISVAASQEDGPGLIVNAPAPVARTYQATGADFNPASFNVTGDLVLVQDGTAPTGDACSALVNAAAVSGHVAVIDRGTCAFTTKVLNAQAAGAIGVVMVNTAGPLLTMTGSAAGITIPSLMISLANGNTLKTAMSTATVNVTLDSTALYADGVQLSSSSERGPQRQPSPGAVALKPDIAAPGVNITSSTLGGGSRTDNGTSMSAPHVAGAALLMRQQHPTWAVDEIKALLMNTATRSAVLDPDVYGPARQGAGALTLSAATNSSVIAYNTAHPEQVSLSFGVLNITAPTARTATITVENKGSTICSYTASFVNTVTLNGVSYSVSPSSFSVGTGATRAIQVRLSVPGPGGWSQPHGHDPTVVETLTWPRHWLSEASGYVELVSQGCGTLRVPVYAAPRPAANLRLATDALYTTDPVGSVDIPMTGAGLDTGTAYPYDEISLVSAFELAYTSDEMGLSGQQVASDIEYVGVTSSYTSSGSNIAATKLFFGISAYGEWSSPGLETRFEVNLDVNEDGTPELVLFNWNLGTRQGRTPTDEFIPVLRQVSTGLYWWPVDFVNYFSAGQYDTTPFQNRVLFVSVPATAMGLSATNTDFNYWVTSQDLNYGQIDSTDVLSYDIAASGLNLMMAGGEAPVWQDRSGPAVTVEYDLTGYDPLPCILLLHHHNTAQPDNRAETVCFRYGTPPTPRPPDENGGEGGGTAEAVFDPAISKIGVLEPGGVGLPGESITWTITVTNEGGAGATDIVVVDEVRPELRIDGADIDVGSVTILGQTVTFVIPSLAPGESVQMRIYTTVLSSPAGGLFINEASVMDRTAQGVLAPRVTAQATVSGVGTLPATGYPPPDESHNGIWAALIGVLAALIFGGIYVFRRAR